MAQGAYVFIRSMRSLPSHANGRHSRARAKQRKKLWPMYARGLRISRASSNSRLMILPSAKGAAGSCAATAATAAPAWRGGCTAVARGSAADVCRSGSLAGGPGKAGGPGLSSGGVGGSSHRSSERAATAAASAATAAVDSFGGVSGLTGSFGGAAGGGSGGDAGGGLEAASASAPAGGFQSRR